MTVITYVLVAEPAGAVIWDGADREVALTIMGEAITDHITDHECRGCGTIGPASRHGYHLLIQVNGVRIAEVS